MFSENHVYQFLGILFLFLVVEASFMDGLFGHMFEDGETVKGEASEGEEPEGVPEDEAYAEVLEDEVSGEVLEGEAVEERFDFFWNQKKTPKPWIYKRTTHAPWTTPPPAWTPAPIIKEITPVQIQAIVETEMIEKDVNEIKTIPYTIGETTFITVPELAIITTTLFTRFTTTVPARPIYKTHTHILDTEYVVDGASIRTQDVLILETEVVVSTDIKTTTLYTETTSTSLRKEYVEDQTTVTVWQPYTVTTTGMTTYTETVTVPIELWKEHRVKVPVVEVRTSTIWLPHHKTVTDWETHTTTTTMCTNAQRNPQPLW